MEDLNIGNYFMVELEEWEISLDSELPTQQLSHIATQYDLYKRQTLPGKVNDVDLFAYALFELSTLFFVTNHQNYARWMTFYVLELSNLKHEKPDVLELLKSGAFSINL